MDDNTQSRVLRLQLGANTQWQQKMQTKLQTEEYDAYGVGLH